MKASRYITTRYKEKRLEVRTMTVTININRIRVAKIEDDPTYQTVEAWGAYIDGNNPYYCTSVIPLPATPSDIKHVIEGLTSGTLDDL